jgi:hypothetical protein
MEVNLDAAAIFVMSGLLSFILGWLSGRPWVVMAILMVIMSPIGLSTLGLPVARLMFGLWLIGVGAGAVTAWMFRRTPSGS